MVGGVALRATGLASSVPQQSQMGLVVQTGRETVQGFPHAVGLPWVAVVLTGEASVCGAGLLTS